MHLLPLWLGLVLAGAQEPPADTDAPVADVQPEAPAEEEEEEPDDLEILVLSERLVQIRRDALIEEAENFGFTRVIQRDDKLILRHELTYRGDLVIHDDGRVRVKRQPIQFRPPFPKVTPVSWLSCLLVPLCIRPNGQLVSPRRFKSYKTEAWASVGDEVGQLHEALSSYGLSKKLEDLPDRLEALWAQGVPLEPDEDPAVTIDDRKARLLAFWDSRTNTEWGDKVRAQVETFLRAVVQPSDTPFTTAEVAAFNAGRMAVKPLVLPLPVASVPEDPGGGDPPDVP